MSEDERRDAGENGPRGERERPDGPRGDETRQAPLAAMGIVAGTVIGAVTGLITGHLAIGAGAGCAAGLIIGAAAQAIRARPRS